MRRLLGLVTVPALAIMGLTACTATAADTSAERQAASLFLTALSKRDATGAAASTTVGDGAKTSIAASLDGLGTATGSMIAGDVSGVTSTAATVAYKASWNFPGVSKPWTYSGSVTLGKTGSQWKVDYAPSDVYPTLTAGQHLAVKRVLPTRGNLLDDKGQPLFTDQPTVTVGIDSTQVTDLGALSTTLAAVLQISASDIVTSVQAAPPGQFVPVITLRDAAYEAVKAKIHDLPGTVFQTGHALLGPTAHFGQPLLGVVGPATDDIVKASKGTVSADDQTGIGGLQQAYNMQLTGTPGISVNSAMDIDGSTVASIITVSAPKPGADVKLTLDTADQTAAENVVTAVKLPASIVITQPSTGKILAVANNAATDGDAALTGQYPPGSTFKIATYAAAFGADATLTPQTPVACPGTITVNGQTIENENAKDRGTIPLSSAFAYSCNTSAVTLGLKLPADALLKAAHSLGFGGKWNLPVEAFAGSLPVPSGASAQNDQAADAYGQGKVLVSPLLMAVMAGAAASGKPVAPTIEVGQQSAPGDALPASVVANLNVLMRDVVTVPGATGRLLASLPGQVEGKTGTAEYGTDVPPQSHSWFAGTRGDLGFSVFVNGGGNSDSPAGAVPVVKSLLTALPS